MSKYGLHLPGLMAAAMLLAPTIAGAQGARGTNAECRTDAATFCAGVEAGGGRKMRCLAENKSSFSPECAAVVETRLKGRERTVGADTERLAQAAPPAGASPTVSPVATVPATPTAPGLASSPTATPSSKGKGQRGNRPMTACRIDMATHCADMQAGGGGRVQCLRANQAKLTPECAAALSAVGQKREVNKVERKQAMRGGCAEDVQRLCADAKGPERRQCLGDNKAQLSPACSAALEMRGHRRASNAMAPVLPVPVTPPAVPAAPLAPPAAPKQ